MRLGEIGDDFAVVAEQFVADGETVVALGSYGWKHKGSGEPAALSAKLPWGTRPSVITDFPEGGDGDNFPR